MGNVPFVGGLMGIGHAAYSSEAGPAAGIQTQRHGTPDDGAVVTGFLASAAARNIIGTQFAVDRSYSAV